MRVTFSTSFRDGTIQIAKASERLAEASRQVSSGQLISRPSDDPGGANAIVTGHASLALVDTYSRTTDAATSRLTVVDSVLTNIIDKISAAMVAATSARGSEQTQSQRDAAAVDLQGISDALFSSMNTQFLGSYLFSGAEATTAPYRKVADTILAYEGDSNVVSVDIDGGRSLQISMDGGAIAQGAEAADIFTVLSDLMTAVTAGLSDPIGQGLDALERAFGRATLAQTEVGARLRGLDDERVQLGVTRNDASARLSRAEDANMAAAITSMSQADTAYRAALGAFANVGRLSLMDYIK